MIAIENHTDNIIGFTIEGKISEGEIEAIGNLMEKKLQTHEKIRMLAEVNQLEGYGSAKAFFEDMQYSLKYWNKIEKAALVADQKWIDSLTNLADMVTEGDFKHFPKAERNIALQWITR